MSLILIEGLDRTGKSTVASYFKEFEGYEVVHLSAPPKDMSRDNYLQEMVDLLYSASAKNIVLDRTHYGELVWPYVYNRQPLLSEEDIEILREIESSVGVKHILMHDSNVEAHWARCVENNEPLSKAQFIKARSMYYSLAKKYNFEMMTLQEFVEKFPGAKSLVDVPKQQSDHKRSVPMENTRPQAPKSNAKTPEQIKLEKANAINDILSRNIIKPKSPIHEEIELEIRGFLNQKLASILGGSSSQELSFTPEEIKFYKAMYKRAVEKGDT